jgi:hypothetical protein
VASGPRDLDLTVYKIRVSAQERRLDVDVEVEALRRSSPGARSRVSQARVCSAAETGLLG